MGNRNHSFVRNVKIEPLLETKKAFVVSKWMTAKRPGSHDMKRLKKWRLLMGAISYIVV